MHTGRKNAVVFANFQKAYNEFIALEYQSEAEDLSQSDSVGILYTEELYDDFDYLEYQLQITYDIVNQQEITSYDNGYLAFMYREDMTIEQETENLSASFDDWMNAVPLQRNYLTTITALLALGVDENVAKEKLGLNRLEIAYIVTDLAKALDMVNLNNQNLEEHLSEVMKTPYLQLLNKNTVGELVSEYDIEALITIQKIYNVKATSYEEAKQIVEEQLQQEKFVEEVAKSTDAWVEIDAGKELEEEEREV